MGMLPRRLLLLMIVAPAAVGAALLSGRGVLVVFGLYQVGVCLLLPAVTDLGVRRWSWRRHALHLGLLGPGTARGIGLGLLLGVVAAGGVLGLYAAAHGRLLHAGDVEAALAAWRVDPADLGGLMLFMALVSGPAEELFWRGFCAAELAPMPSRTLRLLVPSLLYGSYHAVTVPQLMRSPVLAVPVLVGVTGAGLAWAWLRERTGSVWPALLSHGAAAGAYTAIAGHLLDGELLLP